jgi:OmpA-OmpF porin, OOP family
MTSRLVIVLAAAVAPFALVGCRGAPPPTAVPVDPAALVDSDHDGISDARDHCPGTAARAAIEVDPIGCPRDTDNDGFADYRDKCPGTSQGASVDAIGCELDDDADGVFDTRDRCPGSARGDKVDTSGCTLPATRG